MLAIGLGIVAFAGLLTFSRGGVVALVLAAVTCLAALLRAGVAGKKSLLAIAGLVVLVAAALAIHGYEPLARRLGSLGESRSIDELCHGRHALWKAHQAAIPKFPILGTGVGTHREVYPIYMREYFAGEFSHAESGYLHLLLETGFTGLACMLLGIATAVRWSLSHTARAPEASPRRQGIRLVPAHCWLPSSPASSIRWVISFGSFPPACRSRVLLLACVCRLAQLADSVCTAGTRISRVGSAKDGGAFWSKRVRSKPSSARPFSRCGDRLPEKCALAEEPNLPRPAWICLAIGVLAISGVMLWDRVPPGLAAMHWDEYQKVAQAVQGRLL